MARPSWWRGLAGRLDGNDPDERSTGARQGRGARWSSMQSTTRQQLQACWAGTVQRGQHRPGSSGSNVAEDGGPWGSSIWSAAGIGQGSWCPMAAMSGGGNPWCSPQEATSDAELAGSDSGEGRRGRERSRCGGNGAPVAWPLRARLKELGRVSSMALLLWHKRGRERLEKGETRRRGGQEERAGGLAWWMRAMPWWMRSPAATGLTRSKSPAGRLAGRRADEGSCSLNSGEEARARGWMRNR